MKRLLLLLIILSTAPALADNWLALLLREQSPKSVHKQLLGRDAKAKLKVSSKGEPYVKAKVKHLGFTWQCVVDFNKAQKPKEVFLRLLKLQPAQLKQVEKAAKKEYGTSYRLDDKLTGNEKSTVSKNTYTWEISGTRVELVAVVYKFGQGDAWLTLRPLRS